MAWFSRSDRLLELARRVEAVERWLAQMQNELHELAKRIDASQSAVLAANLDDLRSAVDVDRHALRKQLGKIWGTIGASRDSLASPDSRGSGNDELDAWLDIQQQK